MELPTQTETIVLNLKFFFFKLEDLQVDGIMCVAPSRFTRPSSRRRARELGAGRRIKVPPPPAVCAPTNRSAASGTWQRFGEPTSSADARGDGCDDNGAEALLMRATECPA